MQTGCFGCDAVIEADTADQVVDAFLAHGAEAHAWDHPEHALRNFAMNWAEAGIRLADEQERLPSIGHVTVHPVTEDRIDDWLRFFDHDGFAGNPDWAACYCLEPHDPGTPEDPERYWRDNRAAMVQRLRSGGTAGYLAYVDGQAVGWVNASSRSDYRIFEVADGDNPAPSSVIGVSCFVVAPPYRRHGVAAALLDRVVADAPSRGASWLEGYPHHAPEDSDASRFRGPKGMFEARGFSPIEDLGEATLMRRPAV